MNAKSFLSLLLVILLCTSCSFRRLKKEIEYAETNLATLQGEVVSDDTLKKPIIIALLKHDATEDTLYNHWLRYSPGSFRFVVETSNIYDLVAFEDLNGDWIYQPKEPAGICREISGLPLNGGEQYNELQIVLDPKTHLSQQVNIHPVIATETIQKALTQLSMGEEVTLEDPRFTLDNASIGFWEPLRFLREVGSGFYFLEPYDSKKTPVLFVHGLKGYPKIWRDLAEHIDQSKYQRWVCFYPTGLPLDSISQGFTERLTDLQAKYGFTELIVVAHSMGGLVSKSMMNRLADRNTPLKIPLLITMSTPWEGQEAAEMGVKHAPAVVPSWYDMVPNSPFIESLWKIPLPKETTYYLFFSYKGKKVAFTDRNNDGIVALSSQLSLKAQENATIIRGFNVDHTGILSDPCVLNYFGTLLDEFSF